jgi:hypothetical protein
MPKKGITGHDGWVMTEALATALVALKQLPPKHQLHSNGRYQETFGCRLPAWDWRGHQCSALALAQTNLRSPSAPRSNSKRRFALKFNNYLRSALPLREVSSLYVSLGDNPRRIIQLMAALSFLSQR